MTSKIVKIIVYYKGSFDFGNTLLRGQGTTFVMEERYLLEFFPSLIREDIDRVEIMKYDK